MKELVGKSVLYMTGVIDRQDNLQITMRSIRKIVKVHRKYFKIEGTPIKFDYYGRHLTKVLPHRQSAISHCRLVDDVEIAYLKEIWEDKSRTKAMRKFLEDQIDTYTKQLRRL